MQYLEKKQFETKLSRFVFAPHMAQKEPDTADYQKFFDVGGNAFHLHGEGDETVTRTTFGKWINEKNISDDVFVFAQIAHDDGDDPSTFDGSRYSKTRLEQEIRDNLELIQRDHIEALYFGGDNENYSVVDILASMNHQIALGIVNHFGVFNWTPERIAKLQTAAKEKSLTGFTFIITTELCMATPTSAVWEGYTPIDTTMKHVIQEHDLCVLGWATDFNQSLFAPNAFDPNNMPEDRRKKRWYTSDNIVLMEKITSHCKTTQTTARQINLSWMLNQTFDTLAVIYEDMPPSVEEAVGAFDVDISPFR